MTTENEREVYRAHRASQDKYTYFMLTAAGAAIAFATTRTQDASLAWSQIPLGIAVALWGLSFFAGCMNLQCVNAVLYSNADLLRVERGAHPMAGNHPQKMAIGMGVIKEAIERDSNAQSKYARLQFHALIVGAACYVTWHVIEMYARTGTDSAVKTAL